MHSGDVAFLTVLLGAVIATPLAADQAGDIERVRLVLGTSVVYESLPFDEPFYLTGRVDSRVDSVAVRIAESVEPSEVCREARPEAARTGAWRRDESLDADSFYVRVEELPPNRRYELCVTVRSRPSEDRLEDLRTGWRAVVDSAFRANPGSWSPTGGELRRFRAALLTAIGPAVEAAPGSLLDDGTSSEGFVGGLPAVVVLSAAQAERALAIRDIAEAAARAARALASVQRGPALEALVGLRSATGGAPRTLASTHRDAVATAAALRAATRPGLDRIAGGESALTGGLAPDPGARSLSDSWTAEEIEPRGDMLRETNDRLGELLTMVRSLAAAERTARSNGDGSARAAAARTDTGPLAPIGTTLPELRRLEDALQGAIDELAAVAMRLADLGEQLTVRSRALDDAVESLVARERTTIAVEAHTHYDAETAARNHVAADFGAVWLPDLGTVTPVLGANFYLRPVNRDRGPGGHLLRRLAINVGVTTSSLRSPGVRDDLFGPLNLVVGAGLRLTRLLRISGGVVLLRGADPDSPEDDLRLETTPFVGLTLDFVVKDAVSGLFGEIF